MKKEYVLKNMECAHCAQAIEQGLRCLQGVSSVSLNIITSTLRFEVTEGYVLNITQEVERVVNRYEPDVEVIDKATLAKKEAHSLMMSHEFDKKNMAKLGVGLILFFIGLGLGHFSWLSRVQEFAIFFTAYIVLGNQVIVNAAKSVRKGQAFDENFLMSIATFGAFAIGDFAEAAGVMLFYLIGESFQSAAIHKSKKSIAALMNIRPDYATVQQGGQWTKVAPEEVAVGDVILVKPGEKIPLDGEVIEGESMVDTKALTGESVPREIRKGDAIFSGYITLNGALRVQVNKLFGESTAAKILDLLENASSKKAKTENFITTFARYYTPCVVVLAALLAVIPPLFLGGEWATWVHRGLIFLVISCPCALVISIPLGFFGGIGAASKKGILVKGGNYLEALGNLDIVVFDKTGTLTKGVFKLVARHLVDGFSEEELLEYAAHAEAFSSHPIALSIQTAYARPVDSERVSLNNTIAGYGTSARVDNQAVLVGNAKLMHKEGIFFEECTALGTKVYVAIGKRFAGCLVIADELKEDSQATIRGLKARGISQTVMLTGDNVQTAQFVAEQLAIDEVYAELLPQHKVEQMERLCAGKRTKGKLAFVGDGINDAPVLAQADVGIAMGGLGSDAAIEAADVVLMTDEPSKLLEAIDIARATKRIVWQNIVFALGVKGVFLLLGALGMATMWEAVIADVGVSVLAILNAMRILKVR